MEIIVDNTGRCNSLYTQALDQKYISKERNIYIFYTGTFYSSSLGLDMAITNSSRIVTKSPFDMYSNEETYTYNLYYGYYKPIRLNDTEMTVKDFYNEIPVSFDDSIIINGSHYNIAFNTEKGLVENFLSYDRSSVDDYILRTDIYSGKKYEFTDCQPEIYSHYDAAILLNDEQSFYQSLFEKGDGKHYKLRELYDKNTKVHKVGMNILETMRLYNSISGQNGGTVPDYVNEAVSLHFASVFSSIFTAIKIFVERNMFSSADILFSNKRGINITKLATNIHTMLPNVRKINRNKLYMDLATKFNDAFMPVVGSYEDEIVMCITVRNERSDIMLHHIDSTNTTHTFSVLTSSMMEGYELTLTDPNNFK